MLCQMATCLLRDPLICFQERAHAFSSMLLDFLWFRTGIYLLCYLWIMACYFYRFFDLISFSLLGIFVMAQLEGSLSEYFLNCLFENQFA